MGVGERGQEEPPEQAGKHPHRQEEAGLAAHPARAVERYPAARHDHMDVRVVGHRRAPAVEHGGGADASAEVPGIGGDRQQRLGRGAEQEVVDDRLVLVGDRGDLGRQREDDVEIADRQQIGLAGGEPILRRRALALGAMAVAARNGRRPLPALWAKPVMGSWRQLVRGPAAVAASSAHHYEARFSSAINLSVGWKTPRRRCGGTIASIASSFSVGSPRV